jgi:hypothetical protein
MVLRVRRDYQLFGELHDAGVLTDTEFTREKDWILGR